MTSEPVVPRGDGALVRVRVSSNARSTGSQGPCGETSNPKVAAPPDYGKANAGVERFVAQMTRAAPSRVSVVRGLSGRDKTVFVDGVGAERVREAFRPRQR